MSSRVVWTAVAVGCGITALLGAAGLIALVSWSVFGEAAPTAVERSVETRQTEGAPPSSKRTSTELVDFPPAEVALIEGRTKTLNGSIVWTVYNGSEWHLRELTIVVRSPHGADADQWTRRVRESIDVAPLSTSYPIIISMLGAREDQKLECSIESARGRK